MDTTWIKKASPGLVFLWAVVGFVIVMMLLVIITAILLIIGAFG